MVHAPLKQELLIDVIDRKTVGDMPVSKYVAQNHFLVSLSLSNFPKTTGLLFLPVYIPVSNKNF